MYITQDSVIPLLSIYPNNFISWDRDTGSSLFCAGILITARIWKQYQWLSSDE